MSTDEIEHLIQAKGLTAPRVTPESVEAAIVAEQYIQPEGTLLTLCILTLQNGFYATGVSACASPENFRADVGEQAALRNAKQKIWELEGYLLKQRLKDEPLAKLHRDAFETLAALMTNPHINLGDLFYNVRDREGEGLDGPWCRQWGSATSRAAEVIARGKVLSPATFVADDDIPF